jgi:hypothetical protein
MAAPSRLDPRRVIMSQDGLDPVIHAPARTRLMMMLAGRERSQPCQADFRTTDLPSWGCGQAVQHDVLTNSLTRQAEVGETCHNAGDGDQPCALASETRSDPGDQEDARRQAHNPATSVRGLVFCVALAGELEDRGRRGDLGFGWLQDRLPARRPQGGEGLAEASPDQVLAVRHLPPTLIHPGPERLMLGG